MEKKITVYLVVVGEKKVAYPTKARANDAVALLAQFDIAAVVESEKRIVTL